MHIYCVYLTVYRGNKLPPFYIGSTSLKRMSKGYRGSVRSKKFMNIWNEEITKNDSLFDTKIIKTFESRKEALNYEDKIHRKLEVIKNPLYINMAYASGCFGGRIGHKHSTETRLKQSISAKNTKGKRKPRSLESREKMSSSIKKVRDKAKSENRVYADLKGSKNGMYGKTPKNATPCSFDGIEFPSIAAMNRYKKKTYPVEKKIHEFNGIIFNTGKELDAYRLENGFYKKFGIEIHGVFYKTKVDAMKALNLSRNSFEKLIASLSFP